MAEAAEGHFTTEALMRKQDQSPTISGRVNVKRNLKICIIFKYFLCVKTPVRGGFRPRASRRSAPPAEDVLHLRRGGRDAGGIPGGAARLRRRLGGGTG